MGNFNKFENEFFSMNVLNQVKTFTKITLKRNVQTQDSSIMFNQINQRHCHHPNQKNLHPPHPSH